VRRRSLIFALLPWLAALALAPPGAAAARRQVPQGFLGVNVGSTVPNREYPVMARQFVIQMNNWLSFHLEFLRHLAADWADIRATFSPEQEPGTLVQLDGGVGDSHRGGDNGSAKHESRRTGANERSHGCFTPGGFRRP